MLLRQQPAPPQAYLLQKPAWQVFPTVLIMGAEVLSCVCMKREVLRAMKKPGPPKVQRFPAVKQRRLNRLLERNSEGSITPREKAALEQLVAEAEHLMVENARRLAAFSKRDSARRRAVPVTVWVQPQHAEP
jgi:hypothetical protein